ncbi:metallopeptidase family protein [Nocardioides sp. MAHUQ-72]|uniref:metallopeptidase family protein n=1 Tax=unclassified Nocardioides TaxID=2615069 RepID=UPI00360F3779
MDADAVGREEFDELVRDALDQLPDEALRLVAEIAVVVREQPEPGEAEPGVLLLGMFRGIEHTRVGGRVPGSLPDVITLYRRPILAVCRSRDEVAPRVLKVLGHEVGHAFGLSEAQLRAYGWF